MGAIGYYGFLAKRVPPQRLVTVAARRALRSAWQRLGPRAVAPRRDQLLAGLSCPDSITLAHRLAHLRLAPSPWEPEGLRRALDRHLPGEAEDALARAAAAASGRLRIFGREVDVSRPGGGLDWQLDFSRGGRFAGWAPSGALPDAPGLDIKMPWAIGRGEHWVALACAAVLDGRRAREFADALFASVRDFCASNPVGRGVHWVSAMEAALRAVNLLQALWILSGCRLPLDPGFALDAARLAVSTGRFVLAHLEDDTAVPNNHLASDWLGLLACAHLVPDWPEAGRWQDLATAGIARAIRDQVHPEGTSFEGSVPYHRLATEIFTAAAILARSVRAPLRGAYARRLRAMYQATRDLLSAAGELPRIGDDDSGRVLSVRERRSGEAAWLLSLGAALFLDPSLLLEPGPGDAAEVAWLLGPAALDRIARARGGPARRSASFPRGGFHVLRRGRIEAFVSCGPNGQRGLGGHSHNDKLALEVRIGGALAVCDPGSPTYGGDPDLRNAFRSTRAHATVVVDGLEQAPIRSDRPFALPETAAARLLSFDEGEDAARLVGEHRGFVRAEVVHRREVTVASWGAVVVDRLLGSGTHAIEVRWPLAPSGPGARLRPVAPEERDALAALVRIAPVGRPLDLGRAVEVPLAGGTALLLAFACPPRLALDLGPALWSPGYGELRDGAVVLLSGPLACPAAFATLLLPLPVAGGPPS